MNRIRLLSVLVAACTVGVVIYKPFQGEVITELHPATRACLTAQSIGTAELNCKAVLASDEASNTERGAAAFRWAYLSDDEDLELQLELYNQAIDLYPAKTAAFFNRGRLYSLYLKNHKAAAADFTEVIDRIDPANGAFLNAYGLRARAYRNLGKNRRAMNDVDVALRHDPTNLTALEEKAEILLDQKNFDSALEILDKAIAVHGQDDQNVFLWTDRAWVKVKQDDREGALADFNKAIDLGSNTAWTWYWRGRLRMETGQMRAGISDLQTSLTLNPAYCPALRRMSSIRTQLVKVARIEVDSFDRFTSKTPSDDPYHVSNLFLHHLARSQDGIHPEALHITNQLINSVKNPELYMLQRARLYLRMGQKDRAFDAFEKLAERPENYQQIYDEMSEFAQELEDKGQSCAAMRLRYDRSYFWSIFPHTMREIIALEQDQNDVEGMLDSLEYWLENAPGFTSQWIQRGELLESIGRLDEALMHYAEAIRLIDSGEGSTNLHYAKQINTLFRLTSILNDQGRSAYAQKMWDDSLSVARHRVIRRLQKMMDIAGHYEGYWSGRYDESTKAALRDCLQDPNCTWENIGPQM